MKDTLFRYGAVIKLTREDTVEDIERNFRQMKDSGLDTVVVWPAYFWWEEKREGYPFNTGREVLRIAEKLGLSVIMELAGQLCEMEYAPDFMMKDEYYCLDEQGHKKTGTDGYGWLNYFHPELHKILTDNMRAAAEAYKDSPALIAYDVFNETAFSSYDEYTMAEFRLWLSKKYGSIEKLNAVWDRCFSSFDSVTYTPWTWMSIIPGADFGEFRREAVPMIISRWCDAIREVDDRHPFIADNIGSMIVNGRGAYYRPQDDFALKSSVDHIGMSYYPKQINGTMRPSMRHLALDAFYAASEREGFYISELQTHNQAMFNPTTAVRPNELRCWACESLAAGAIGIIYWMWRPFTKGLQTAGRGLVDYKGRSTPRLELASEIGELVRECGKLTPRRAKIGILFDVKTLDFQLLYTKNYGALDQDIYLESIRGAYEAAYDIGARADVVKIDELDGYDLVILSNTVVMTDRSARKLKEFVEGGGTVLIDGKHGLVDGEGRLHDMLPGGALNDALGHEFIDVDYVGCEFDYKGEHIRANNGRELTRLTDGVAETSFFDGTPALIEKKYGKGRFITVNTSVFYGYTKGRTDADKLLSLVGGEAALPDVRVSSPFVVRIAESKTDRYAFVFNYSTDTAKGRLEGLGFDSELTVAAGDVKVVSVKK